MGPRTDFARGTAAPQPAPGRGRKWRRRGRGPPSSRSPFLLAHPLAVVVRRRMQAYADDEAAPAGTTPPGSVRALDSSAAPAPFLATGGGDRLEAQGQARKEAAAAAAANPHPSPADLSSTSVRSAAMR
mmetsp:Transcript_54174/g.162200  ORF Transcript_54174/g.162200 Transcript_54174/m.162200 type:complete len:129 (+) Transcript_54174:297-683(+)